MAISAELIQHLYEVEKYCTERILWQSANSTFPHYKFIVPVVTADEELLRWVGYAQTKFSIKRFGFVLTYQRKYVIRSWDLSKQHWSKAEQRYIKGAGRHKHYYLDVDAPRDVYEIAEGEISVDDPNEALLDFARECNITIISAYQSLMLK